MNERIRQLAEQAGIVMPKDSEYNGHVYRNSIERFARLIAQECIGLAEICRCIDGSRDPEPYTQGVHDAIHITVQRIEAEFGVEA